MQYKTGISVNEVTIRIKDAYCKTPEMERDIEKKQERESYREREEERYLLPVSTNELL